MEFTGRGILLDIEGTTGPIAYVHQTLFPYARRALADFLERTWDDAATRKALELAAHDHGDASLDAWAQAAAKPIRTAVLEELHALMDRDAKATGLKELQGLIWKEGYRKGELKSQVYDDVPPSLRRWRGLGLDVRIYSSGSVTAQKVFFEHTEAGDLTPLFQGHYDTTVGPKKEAESYRKIAADMGLPAAEVLFLSDIEAELDGASSAGMQTGLVLRPGNAPVPSPRHPTLADFGTLEVRLGPAAQP